jgi:tetratricopeptide (TPR) repeat protein
MATATVIGHWMPLTWLSFGLDYVVWGLRPFGYHLTSVLLHAANAALVCQLAARLLARAAPAAPAGARGAGAVAAGLAFAIHPLRVESVAWLAERGTLVASLFLLLALQAHLTAIAAAARPRARWWRAASITAYALALTGKGIVMTAPLVLVLLDVYPLRRLPRDPRRWGDRSARVLWSEKLPYLVLGLLGALTAYRAKEAATPLTVLDPATWLGKLAYGLWFGVYRTLVPVDLSPLYELPQRIYPLAAPFLTAGLAVIAVTVALVLLRDRWPAGLAAWTYYVIAMIPVTAVAHSGFQLTADRYTYLAGLGWALLAGGGVMALARARRGLAVALVVAVALALGALTWRQAGVWHDSERLWRHAVAVTPDCSVCHAQLGNQALRRGDPATALAHYRRADALRPDRMRMRAGMGEALLRLGQVSEAADQFRRFLVQNPSALPARINWASALLTLGRPREAAEALAGALEAAPAADLARAFGDLARRHPDAAIPVLGLVQAHAALGQREAARAAHARLRALDPELAATVAGLVAAP